MGRRSNELKHEINEKLRELQQALADALHTYAKPNFLDSTKLTKRYASSPNPLIPWLDSTNDLQCTLINFWQRGIKQGLVASS